MSADAQMALAQASELLQMFYRLREEGQEGVRPAIRFLEGDAAALRQYLIDGIDDRKDVAEGHQELLAEAVARGDFTPESAKELSKIVHPIGRLHETCRILRERWSQLRPEVFTTAIRRN